MPTDSMQAKIRTFLTDAGYPPDTDDTELIKLLRFFEQEYDAQILVLLEQEWLRDEIERDVLRGDFDQVRDLIPPEHRSDFDAQVNDLLS